MAVRLLSHPSLSIFRSREELLATMTTDAVLGTTSYFQLPNRVKIHAFPALNKVIPDADPPSFSDVNLLHDFFDRSTKLVVLTGAGISTECGIPEYRSPNGAYSSGFKPITHQEFLQSSRARRRYWARSYAGWRQFNASKPGAAHIALASLENAGWINYMITQNVDRLHHRAGSNPLELHGTVYTEASLCVPFIK